MSANRRDHPVPIVGFQCSRKSWCLSRITLSHFTFSATPFHCFPRPLSPLHTIDSSLSLANGSPCYLATSVTILCTHTNKSCILYLLPNSDPAPLLSYTLECRWSIYKGKCTTTPPISSCILRSISFSIEAMYTRKRMRVRGEPCGTPVTARPIPRTLLSHDISNSRGAMKHRNHPIHILNGSHLHTLSNTLGLHTFWTPLQRPKKPTTHTQPHLGRLLPPLLTCTEHPPPTVPSPTDIGVRVAVVPHSSATSPQLLSPLTCRCN